MSRRLRGSAIHCEEVLRALATKFNVLEHLDYLRLRLLRALLAYLAASVAAYFAVPHIMPYLLHPEAGLTGLVFLSPVEAFFSQLKIALALGLVLALPLILYQFWALFVPAMSRAVRRASLMLIPVIYLLFVGGCLFALVFVLPLALRFFLAFGGEPLHQEIAIGSYVNFLIGFVLPFGFLFELPVAILALVRLGMLDPVVLARNRKYAIFIIFVVAAVLTPADVFSQLLLAFPLLALFEVSLFLARLFAPRRALRGGDEDEAR